MMQIKNIKKVMKILTWKKFNESEKYADELAFNNGIFALNLNFDISQFESIYQLKSKITTPYVTSCNKTFTNINTIIDSNP